MVWKWNAILVVLAAGVIWMGCDELLDPDPIDARWSFEGLEGMEVYSLAVEDEQLLAGTEDGLYARSLAEDASWEPLGFEGRRINDVLILNRNEFLIAVAITGDEDDAVSLFRSYDGGQSWEPSQEGFGAGESTNEVRALARAPDTNIVFASGQAIVVARSEDAGQTWHPVWGDWDRFGLGTHALTVHPQDTDIIWAGGEEGAFVPFLVHSEDGGDTWEEYHPDLAGDNATNSIALDPSDSDVVLAGMEGVLLRSTDGGDSWDFVLEPDGYPYFFGLTFSAQQSRRVYAAGAQNHPDPQPLVLFVSNDRGATWNEVRHAPAEFGGVFDLLSIETVGREALYIATQEGVFRYEP